MTSTIDLYTTEAIDSVERLAAIYARSSLARGRSIADIIATLHAGVGLEIGPVQAMMHIQVLQGRLCLDSAMTVALCLRRRDLCEYFVLLESTDTSATYETRRVGAPAPVRMSYTVAQAQAAGLLRPGPWMTHRAAMLRARCASALARAVHQDLVAGLYDPDEVREIEESERPRGRRRPNGHTSEAAADDLPDDPPQPACVGAFVADLSAAQGLADIGATWRRHDRALHTEDATTPAQEAVATHLDRRGYVLMATEVTRVLAQSYPERVLALLDAVSAQSTADAVISWYQTPEIRAAVEALEPHDRDATKLVIARTWTARAGVATTRVRAAFAAALAAAKGDAPSAAAPPPTEPAADAARPHAEVAAAPSQEPAAPAAPQPITTSRGTVIKSEEDGDTYARAVTALKHLQSAARRYGSHPFLRAPLARRLAELAGISEDDALAQVDRLAVEGARPAGGGA